MNRSVGHIWIAGSRAAIRAQAAEVIGATVVSVNCHRQLRGPYSGVNAVLQTLVPGAYDRWPSIVDDNRVSLLYAAPELASLIGPPAATLTSSTPHEERTRFFGQALARCISHGIVNFLAAYGEHLAAYGEHLVANGERVDAEPVHLFFDNAHEADPTEQEFLALALRRISPEKMRIIVGTASGKPLLGELAAALDRYACRTDAGEGLPPTEGRTEQDLLRAFVISDGTSDDSLEREAYERSTPDVRMSLHDRRADELERSGPWSLRLGAIPYHREHGSDPQGAGCQALLTALEYCLAMGFYPALLDLGERGSSLADPQAQQVEYCQFTAKAAGALVALGRPEEAERLYLGLRTLYTLPRVHMSTSYSLAMLYTRWYPSHSKDHNLAKVFCNNAIALAMHEPDPQFRAFFTVFQSNGLALVEMHLGNPERALELVIDGIRRLDKELPADKFLVHRSQLLHNRARVLDVLGRHEECLADFGRLLQIDPNHAEYYIDRGNILRKCGDDDAALADYERARLLSPPFPEVYYNRGDVRAARGDLAGAVADFSYVLDMEPRHLDARISLIELLIEQGEAESAAAQLREARAYHPDSAALWTLAAVIALSSGDLREARRNLDNALMLDPDFAAARLHRAEHCISTAEHETAAIDFTRAMAVLGPDPELCYQRALCYLAVGDHAAARKDLLTVVACEDSVLAGEARALLAEMAVASITA